MENCICGFLNLLAEAVKQSPSINDPCFLFYSEKLFRCTWAKSLILISSPLTKTRDTRSYDACRSDSVLYNELIKGLWSFHVTCFYESRVDVYVTNHFSLPCHLLEYTCKIPLFNLYRSKQPSVSFVLRILYCHAWQAKRFYVCNLIFITHGRRTWLKATSRNFLETEYKRKNSIFFQELNLALIYFWHIYFL